MSYCEGITIKGHPCKIKVKKGNYCSRHAVFMKKQKENKEFQLEIEGISILPSEIWRIIISFFDIKSMACLHLTCTYFYYYMKEYIQDEGYMMILLTSTDEHIEGNSYVSYRYGLSITGDSYYIKNNIVIPYNINIKNTELILSKRIITMVRTYSCFVKMVNMMIKESYHEDINFSFQNNIEDSFSKYVEKKTVETLVRKILSIPKTLEEKEIMTHHYKYLHSIPISFGVRTTYWSSRDFRCLVKKTADHIREVYPKFQLCIIPGNILYFSFKGISIY